MGAVRGRTQFRLPNGHYAKVDRTTGKIVSIKADRAPYKGVVITAAPPPLPRRANERRVLPALISRGGLQSRRPGPLVVTDSVVIRG